MPPKEPISVSTEALKVALRQALDAGLGRVRGGDVDAGLAVVHGSSEFIAKPRDGGAPPAGAALAVRCGSEPWRPTPEFADLERTLEDRRQQVEAALRRLVVAGGAPAVEAAVADSLFAPGKRLRPILSLLVAEVLKGNPEAVLPAGCARSGAWATRRDRAEIRRGRGRPAPGKSSNGERR